jgi:death-on-curing protein
MHSIINNHCFVDGNKRVGFALTAIFLRLNGFQLKVPSKEAEFFIVEEIIGNGVDAYEIAVWLEKFLQPVQE